MSRHWKQVERDAVKALKKYCHASEDCRRTAQVDGGLSADVTSACLPGLHVEIKSRKRLSVWEFMLQAMKDAKDKAPVVLMKSDGRVKGQRDNFLVMFRIEDTEAFVRAWTQNEQRSQSKSSSPASS